MANKKRWMKAVIETAAKSDVKLPWTRGAQRDAMITARKKDRLPDGPHKTAPVERSKINFAS